MAPKLQDKQVIAFVEQAPRISKTRICVEVETGKRNLRHPCTSSMITEQVEEEKRKGKSSEGRKKSKERAQLRFFWAKLVDKLCFAKKAEKWITLEKVGDSKTRLQFVKNKGYNKLGTATRIAWCRSKKSFLAYHKTAQLTGKPCPCKNSVKQEEMIKIRMTAAAFGKFQI